MGAPAVRDYPTSFGVLRVDAVGRISLVKADPQNPGSRGGRGYWDDFHKWHYGTPPDGRQTEIPPWLQREAVAEWPRVARTDPVRIRPGRLAHIRELKALRRAAQVEYETLPVATNQQTGRTIHFPTTGWKEIQRHSADRRLLKLIPSLPDLIKSALLIYREPERETDLRRNIAGWHNYAVRAVLDEETLYVHLTTWQEHGLEYLNLHDTQVVSRAEMARAIKGGLTPLTMREGSPGWPGHKHILVHIAHAHKLGWANRPIAKARLVVSPTGRISVVPATSARLSYLLQARERLNRELLALDGADPTDPLIAARRADLQRQLTDLDLRIDELRTTD